MTENEVREYVKNHCYISNNIESMSAIAVDGHFIGTVNVY